MKPAGSKTAKQWAREICHAGSYEYALQKAEEALKSYAAQEAKPLVDAIDAWVKHPSRGLPRHLSEEGRMLWETLITFKERNG